MANQRLTLAENIEQANIAEADFRMEATAKLATLDGAYGELASAQSEYESRGVAFGESLNAFINDGFHIVLDLNTNGKIAAHFGCSEDQIRAMRLTAALLPLMQALGLPGTDGFYWGREIVKGLKETNETGDDRKVKPELYAGVTGDTSEETLLEAYPNTVRRLMMMAECLNDGMLEIEAARAAASADRGGFESVADQQAEQAASQEDAEEASTKSPYEKALEAISRASKLVNALEGDERKAAIDAGKSAFTKAGLEANA